VGEAAAYDHGAQYFTARDPRFARQVRAWREEGLVAEWEGRIAALGGPPRAAGPGRPRRFVGLPGMSAIAAHLAADVALRCRVRIEEVSRGSSGWTLRHEGGEEGPFDGLVLALPAPRALPLLADAPAIRDRTARVRMTGCWAVLVSFSSPLGAGFDAAFVNSGPLSWIARDGSKPGRRGESWVLHASPDWTEDHRDALPDEVCRSLLDALARALGVDLPGRTDLRAHLWPHAQPVEALSKECLFDEELALAVCGDWCGGPRVEGAFLSGAAAAGRMLNRRWPSGDPVQGGLFSAGAGPCGPLVRGP
jgi:predicted NAD/FAD-dependent oxidoreductase